MAEGWSQRMPATMTKRDGAHLKPMSPTVRPLRAWNGTDSPPAPGWLLSAGVAGSGCGSERGMVLRITAANSSPVISGCTVMRAVPARERIRSSCGGQRRCGKREGEAYHGVCFGETLVDDR